MTITDRIQRGYRALAAHPSIQDAESEDGDVQTNVVDTIADILHYARSVRVDPADAARIAADHEATEHLEAQPNCAWFAACEEPATDTQSHPILGDVPVCGRCKRFVEGAT